MPKKKRPASPAATKARKLSQPKYKAFRLAKKIKPVKKPIPTSVSLFAQTLRLMKRHWRTYGILALLYLVVTVLVVRGLNVSIGAADIKASLTELFDGGELLASVTLFGVLLSSANAANGEAAGIYQGMFMVVFSLATVWLLRQLWSEEKKLAVRDAFYQGMYPLIPFILVLFVIGLQLIPLYVASFIAGTVYGTGVAVAPLEQIVWALLLILLIVLSAYWLSSSIFALFIATIPKTKPVQALRSASELVRHRRLLVLRRLLFLPFALFVLTAIIIFPLIVISPVIAEWTFLVLSAAVLPASVTYLYGLYRGLLA